MSNLFYTSEQKPLSVEIKIYPKFEGNTVEVLTLTNEHIKAGSFVLDMYRYNTNEFCLGNLVASEIRFSVLRSELTDSVKYESAEVIVKVIDKTNQSWQIKGFTIDSAFITETSIDITALDRTVQLDKMADIEWGESNKLTVEALANQCVRKGFNDEGASVEFITMYSGHSNVEIENYKNWQIDKFDTSDISYRTVLKYLAEILGCNPYLDLWLGNRIVFMHHLAISAPEHEINKNHIFNSTISENPCEITGVSVRPIKTGDDEPIPATVGTTDYMLSINGNPLVTESNKQLIAEALSVYTKDYGYGHKYYPFSATILLPKHPTYFRSIGTLNIKGKVTIISSIKWYLNGTCQIACKGETKTQKGWAELNPYTKRENAIIKRIETDTARLTAHTSAVKDLNETLAGGLGLKSEVIEGQKYYHNGGDSIENATFIITVNSGGIGYASSWNNGSPVFTTGYDATKGKMLAQMLQAHKIQADEINVSNLLSISRLIAPSRATESTASVYIDTSVSPATIKLGGFNVGSSAIYKDITSMTSSATSGVYVGTDGFKLGNKFKVDSGGNLTATSGLIGGFNIGASALYKDITSMTSTATSGVYVGTDGFKLGDKFKVDSTGSLDATLSSITTSYFDKLIGDGFLLLGSRSDSWNGERYTGTYIKKNYISVNSNNSITPAACYMTTNSDDTARFGIVAKNPNIALQTATYSICTETNNKIICEFIKLFPTDTIENLFQQTWKTNTTIRNDLTFYGSSESGYVRCTGRWEFSNLIQTSDRNLKNTIQALDDRYSTMFDNLQPVRFLFNDREDEGYHIGFIAQECGKAGEIANLAPQEIAYHNTQGINQSLAYHEITALNTNEIQRLKARIIELERTLQPKV